MGDRYRRGSAPDLRGNKSGCSSSRGRAGSGDSSRERGMSKAGNRHVRALAIEIAWGWLRYQPESELSRWYQRRFGDGSSRGGRIGVGAVAREVLGAQGGELGAGRISQ